MNEDERALRTVELWLAKNRQAEANCNRTEANFRKAEVALQKFRARGPHKKQKPGRPGFWKSPAGLLFVREVDSVREKRNCSIAFAIKTVKLKAIRWSRWYQARPPRDLIIETVKRLARTSCSALQVRYQEARRYWSFLLDSQLYQREEEALKRNFDEALSTWGEAVNAWAKLKIGAPTITLTRNPYDFS